VAELFEKIEVNREPRWPVLSKLVAGSLVVHILFVIGILYVPSVRDAFSMVAAFSDVGYVDREYQKTKIGDRAIMLALKDGKFTYPPGYFAVPVSPAGEMADVPKPPEAKIISEYKEEKPKPTPKPKVSPQPVATPVPSPELTAQEKAAELLAKAKDKESANQALDQVANSGNVERPEESKINKKPLKDWVANADKLRLAGKLDLTKTVELEITADREPDGTLTNVFVVRKDGDPQLIEVAKDLAAAISDSKVLYFLQDTKHLRMTMRLDTLNVMARVETDVGSEERAGSLAKTYAALLYGGQLIKKGQDEEALYKAARVKADGKQVIVNFSMPRETATGILKKYAPEPTPPAD
jgi:outer membrane biosynthesis protein TonB